MTGSGLPVADPPLVLRHQTPELHHLVLKHPELSEEVLGPGDVGHGGVVGAVPEPVQVRYVLLEV